MTALDGMMSNQVEVSFPEPIRLVVWDLDETFWDGTLTEGGIGYRQDNHDLVIALAHRGIMNSICSKNDRATIETLLRDRGLWDYFVFPSINWEPKGQRIAAIIAAIQLRPASVLFVDDNAMNLQEARFISPDLQVASPQILASMLARPEFVGKDDGKLSRLSQYKMLEDRQSALADSGDDNLEFLRNSDIRVHIDYDVEKNLDRAIEIINRTNQLNFTKRRLSEDQDTARSELLVALRRNTAHAGIISVRDRFGDYGHVGLFVLDRIEGLLHFCFSCRILNMHVERWVYQHLGRPRINVVGEVLCDIFVKDPRIDWVEASSLVEGPSAAGVEAMDSNPVSARYPSVFARGGCDIASLTHYFSAHTAKLVHEANFQRGGVSVRIDHSHMLCHALHGLSEPQIAAAKRIGYGPGDFKTDLSSLESGLVILSFWADASVPLYRHKTLGLELPFWLIGAQARNLIADHSVDSTIADTPEAATALASLREDYIHIGIISHEDSCRNYTRIFKRLPVGIQAVVLLANEYGPPDASGSEPRHPWHVQLNIALREAAAQFPEVHLLDVSEFVNRPGELFDFNHFHRMVYHRIYEGIVSKPDLRPRAGERAARQTRDDIPEPPPEPPPERPKEQKMQNENGLSPRQIAVLQNSVRRSLAALQTQIQAYGAASGWGAGFLLDGASRTPRQELLDGAQLLTDRIELLKRLPKGGRVAEIGTLRGAFAQKILELCAPEELHILDLTFSRLTPEAKAAFAAHGRVTLHEGPSWELLARIPDRYFDWVYVDGDHSHAGVSRDIEQALRVVKPGGILIFNDYMPWSPIQMMAYGVQAAVNEAINTHGWKVIYMAFEARGYHDLAVRLPE